MPSTVQLKVVEEKSGRGMRLEYVFGVRGEKGFTHATKWITLEPERSRMVTHWKWHQDIAFRTSGLDTFAQAGFGRFVANSGSQTDPKVIRVTFEVHPESLNYLWETSSDGSNFTTYSRFEFKRESSSPVQ